MAGLARSKAGTSVFDQWMSDLFVTFEPTEAHKKLPLFNWRAIATTNYDLLVEKAYDYGSTSQQSLVVRYKDQQPHDVQRMEFERPLSFLKLHGCSRHALDSDVPLVLTPETYNSHEKNRQFLYGDLEQLAAAQPIVYCGHSLSDLHIRRLSEDGERERRPFHYLVKPDVEEEEIVYWAERRVEVVRATFASFLNALEAALPPLMRIPQPRSHDVDRPYRKFFVVNEEESDQLRAAMDHDLNFVHSAMDVLPAEAKEFYSGHELEWGAVRRNFDVHRRASHNIIEIIAETPSTEQSLIVLKGPAGFGKTIALRRAAWELGTSLDELVVWANDESRVWANVVQELHELTGRRVILFSDRAAYNVGKLSSVLDVAASKAIPLTVVTAERVNEWSMYCQPLEKHLPNFVELNRLSKREVEDLVEKLEQHNCLGALAQEPPEQRSTIISEKLDRQLLVILHEVTRGLPFEQILKDEFDRLAPPEAQTLYLDICTLNQFDVPARAGAISRLSGIRFRDFELDFFEPLEGLVETTSSPITGDYEYRARHAHVSEIVFTQVCQTDEDRSAQLTRVIAALDPGYRSDSIALSGILRGRSIAETFEDPIQARDVYAIAHQKHPSTAFIFQQRAIFEMHHAQGSLDNAQVSIDTALQMEPTHGGFLHTRSLVLRRMAKDNNSEFASNSLRNQARAALDKAPDQRSPYILTARANLRVDEFEEALRRNGGKVDGEAIVGKALEDADRAIVQAKNSEPNEPELLRAQARLRELLGDDDHALQLLKRAWAAMPKGSGVAKQLVQRLVDRGSHDAALDILDEAIQRDATDRGLQFLAARVSFERSGDLHCAKALIHLKSSFVNRDREHWNRFIAASHAFATGNFSFSSQLFNELHSSAPPPFRPKLGASYRWLTDPLRSRTGSIMKSHGSFFFIAPDIGSKQIYAPESASERENWDELDVGSKIYFDLSFNRQGPIAAKLRLVS